MLFTVEMTDRQATNNWKSETEFRQVMREVVGLKGDLASSSPLQILGLNYDKEQLGRQLIASGDLHWRETVDRGGMTEKEHS